MNATATISVPGRPVPSTAPLSLPAHLAAHGLRAFDDPRKHRRWMRGKIGARQCSIIDWYRDALGGYFPHPEQRTAMYDEMAAPDVFGPVASERFDAMRASGEAILPFLPPGGCILDIGSAIGVLTAWYALHVPGALVTGCDNAGKAVATATEAARAAGSDNLRYAVADVTQGLPQGPFDLVISTQSVVENDEHADALRHIAAVLTQDGTYVAIEPLPSVRHVTLFTNLATEAGLVLQSLTMTPYRMFGVLQAYPVLVFRHGPAGDAGDAGNSMKVDIPTAYAEAYRPIFGEDPPSSPSSPAGDR